MKAHTHNIVDNQAVQTSKDLLFNLEMGNQEGKAGNEEEAINYYIKGLQIAKDSQDKARIKQFSNLILTYL